MKIINLFKKRPKLIEQSLEGYPYYLREVRGDNGMIFMWIPEEQLQMYLSDSRKKYFYTRIGDKIIFPSKSGCKKLFFK